MYTHLQIRMMKELSRSFEQVDALERIANALRPLLEEARAAKALVAVDVTLDKLNRVEQDIEEMWGDVHHRMERVTEVGISPDEYEAWASNHVAY